MAKAAGHQFGQVLGNFLEEVVLQEILHPKLAEFTRELGYYLDFQKIRRARSGKKVIWKDKYGNDHSLDFVIEAGGTEDRIGRPIAFIESAWRRYTKHSKNKAQEIQGAVLPVVEAHTLQAPFVGVVLAGEFTEPSIRQLTSLKFSVIHIPYHVIVDAFGAVGIGIKFDQATDDADFYAATTKIQELTKRTRKVATLRSSIRTACEPAITRFLGTLHAVLRRHIVAIAIVPAWGLEHQVASLDEAKKLLSEMQTDNPQGKFLRFEVSVRYSNGDVIRAEFEHKQAAIDFIDLLDSQR